MRMFFDNVIIGNFPLDKEPVSAQLTVHINNYDASRYPGAFVADYRDHTQGTDYQRRYDSIIAGMIEYYGQKSIDGFLDMFHIGWTG